MPPLVICLLLAGGFTAIAGTFAVRLSREYYTIAPYHYDSATYRMQAVHFYNVRRTQGLIASVWQSAQVKDSLDISLRLIFLPGSLLNRFGHLVMLLPYMGAFLLLAMWYVHVHTGSLWPGVASVTFLFAFPLIYGPNGAPYIGGIADYWKDNLAVWLFGCAVLSWLLSRSLSHPRWSALAGSFLGLLLMQRAVMALYAGGLLLPLFLWNVSRRVREDGLPRAVSRIAALIAPAMLLGGGLIAIQWRQLYRHYFVAGYSYGTPWLVASYLSEGLRDTGLLVGTIAVGLGILGCVIGMSFRHAHLGDVCVSTWLLLALPLVVVSTSAFYFGFYPLWQILLLVLLLAIVSHGSTQLDYRGVVTVMLGVALFFSAIQYNIWSTRWRALAEFGADKRIFYRRLVDIVASTPGPHEYALLFDEVDYPFMNQALFERRILLGTSVVYVSVHDSYYRAGYGGASVQQIVDANIKTLERHSGIVVVAFCEPGDALRRPEFLQDGQHIAAPVAVGTAEYLRRSLSWQATHKLLSPYGCLYAYRNVGTVRSPVEKWQKLSFVSALPDIPLALAVAPRIRLYDYVSRYQPELINGVHSQWLPPGRGGLRLQLFSDEERKVLFTAHVQPGSARRHSPTTIVGSDGKRETRVSVTGEQDIQIGLELQPGLNQIEVYVQESAGRAEPSSPGNADERDVMVLLSSPRITVRAE